MCEIIKTRLIHLAMFRLASTSCVSVGLNYNLNLMAHNWQIWKSRFLTCHCQNSYGKSSLSIKLQFCFKKNMVFVNMWDLGQFSENLILFITARWKFESKNPLAHVWLVSLWLSVTFHFYLIDFQLNTDFPSEFCVFLP